MFALSFVGVIWILVNWKRVPLFKSVLPSARVAGSIRSGLRYARYAPDLRASLVWRLLFRFYLGDMIAAGHRSLRWIRSLRMDRCGFRWRTVFPIENYAEFRRVIHQLRGVRLQDGAVGALSGCDRSGES